MLDWIGVALNLWGVILNARKKISCWPIWMVSNVVWLYYWISKEEWGACVLVISYLILNVYGWRTWAKGREDGEGAEDSRH